VSPYEVDEVITGCLMEGVIHKGLFQLSQYQGPQRDSYSDAMMIDAPTAQWMIKVLQAALDTGELDDGEDNKNERRSRRLRREIAETVE